ncbi:disease resistance protein [Salix suchowensis]|nr:disease resistance protein [Salix suchowensis]
MPYFNCTEEIGKPDSVPGNYLEVNLKLVFSSRVADSTGESSQETFKSNYAKLPDYLKSCLDYSSIVSKRHPVEIGKLVRLLLAEGLIQDKPGDIMEVVAANIVKELIDLGMLREVGDGSEVEVPASYLHLSILKLEKQDYVAKTANLPVRLAIRDDGRDIFPNVEGRLIQSLSIITAERRHYSSGSTGGLSRAYMRNVCGMRFLLVLDLDGKIVYLPDEVGDLIHLRYLGVVNSDLDELPRTLEVVHIQQLRHLLMSKSIGDCEIRVPEGIGKMVNLHTLSGIYGGDGIARELSALTQIRHLGVKRVSEDHAGELFAAIEKMENLESLSLEAEGCFFEETSPTLFPELDAFSPPPLLQEFYLQGGLTEIPMWLASMENLTRLALSFSYLSESPTSALQFLPKLKHLNLWEAYKAKQIGKEFCSAGGFGLQNISTLQELYLGSMHPDLARRLKGEDNYKIKHIPKLTFGLALRNIML